MSSSWFEIICSNSNSSRDFSRAAALCFKLYKPAQVRCSGQEVRQHCQSIESIFKAGDPEHTKVCLSEVLWRDLERSVRESCFRDALTWSLDCGAGFGFAQVTSGLMPGFQHYKGDSHLTGVHRHGNLSWPALKQVLRQIRDQQVQNLLRLTKHVSAEAALPLLEDSSDSVLQRRT